MPATIGFELLLTQGHRIPLKSRENRSFEIIWNLKELKESNRTPTLHKNEAYLKINILTSSCTLQSYRRAFHDTPFDT